VKRDFFLNQELVIFTYQLSITTMSNSISPQARLELITLAETIRQTGIKSGARDMILVGNGLITLLSASEHEETLQALNSLLLQFTLRQLQRDAGLNDAQIMACEALDPQRLN
jgi:hypothetical protein